MKPSREATEIRFQLHPKQLEAINSAAQFLLYGGSAGCGKSHYLRVEGITACLAYPGLQVYLFRRKYKELIQNHMRGPTSFHALLAPLKALGLVEIVELEIRFKNGPNGFDDGSRIFLCHCNHEADVWNYLGPEIHLLLLEEATQLTEFIVRFLCGRMRIPAALKIPKEELHKWPRIRATANPGGPGHTFFKHLFVDRYDAERAKHLHEFPAWKMDEDDGGWTAQFIPAKLSDNPSIDPVKYRAALLGLKRKELIDALLDGRWDVPLGAMFPELDEKKHRVDPGPINDYSYKFRTFDWGSAAPFAVLWWTVSDGSTGIPKGALVCYREWYGASRMDKSRGLGLSNEQLALGIRERTLSNELIQGTVTDSKPFQAGGGQTIAEDFGRFGVPLLLGDVKPGSRIQGWQQLRSRLIGHNGEPMIYFTRDCIHTWRTLVALQTDEQNIEDADTTGEDHAPDAVSLACKARPYVKEAPKEPPPRITAQPARMGAMIEKHLKSKRFEDAVQR